MTDVLNTENQNQTAQPENTKSGFEVLAEKIGKEEIQKAMQTLQTYKTAKSTLEQKIIDNEKWYRLRHWESLRDKEQEIQPVSAWLFNSIANKHADCMDNFPSPNILPREAGDRKEAQMLSSIIPVILDQCEFEQVYSDANNYKLKQGASVYGVFWDGNKLNGLGDVSIKKIDLLNLFWEPGITDIQQSHNVFSVELIDNETIKSTYPNVGDKLATSAKTIDIAKYSYDDTVPTDNKSVVVDWYYRKLDSNGVPRLHYCKFVNDIVLFATENEQGYENGIYEHCNYPFVFDVLYPIEGTPVGFGYIDIGKDCQAYIDRANQAILKNMFANSSPRYFIRNDGSVNEGEYADQTKEFVHIEGNSLGDDSIRPIEGKPLNSIYYTVLSGKIDELKETTGNRDIQTGGTTSGVTAASAIAAMQEAGSKLSRDSSKSAYRTFRKICLMVIELIRQFYTTERCFRIVGDDGGQDFVNYSNANIVPQSQGKNEFGVDVDYRVPLFDIEVSAQKSSPYSKMAQNELALQFYNAGFFNPQMASQALTCLDMMDFERKQFIMNKIAENGTLYDQLVQTQQKAITLARMVDEDRGTNLTGQIINEFTGGQAPVPMASGDATQVPNLELSSEPNNVRQAKERTAAATSPT